jgi:hypothetical protein
VTTAKSMHAAERHVEICERAALAARSAVLRASTRDGRLMGMLASNDPRRIAYEKATAASFEAERKATAARERVEQLRRASIPKPSVQETRAELKAAIANELKTRRAIARHETAIETSRSMLTAAEDRLSAATAAIERAKQSDANAVAKAAASSGKAPASVLPKVRAAEESARDQLEAARAARRALEDKRAEIERAHETAKRKVETCINGVLRCELPIAKLIDRCAADHATLVSRRLVLQQILRDGLADGDLKDRARAVLYDGTLPGDPAMVDLRDWSRATAVTAWAGMRKQLAADAGAELLKLMEVVLVWPSS